MKTKNQLTNRILSLVLALVMMVGLLPTISFTASAATAELFQGFDTYGITITSVYFALPNASNGSVLTIYGGSHVIYKATLELYIEGEPVNGKVTACFSFSWEDYLNGKKIPGKLELDCSCDKTYAYGTMSPEITFDDGSILYINMKKNAQSHNMDWKSNGNNTHTSTCSACDETVTEACGGATDVTCTKYGTCTACGASYNAPNVHEWKYSVRDNIITKSCDCNKVDNATATLSADKNSYAYTGSEITPLYVEYSSNWTDEKPTIMYFNNTELGYASGSITINGCTATKTFRIEEANISDATITLNPENGTYNGNAYAPDVTVTFNGATLVKDTDYVLSWEPSELTNAGSHTATITGKGNFTGTKTAAFTIDPADIKGVVVTLDQNSFVYDGLPHKPTASVTFNGDTLTEGVDYEVYYLSSDQIMKWNNGEPEKFFGTGKESCDSINAGQYYAVVFGKGNFAANSRFAYAAYTIKQAKNAWVTEPSISGWTYGEAAKAPVGEAKFGEVSVEYSGTTNGGATYSSLVAPTEAGSYKATFTVQETEDYSALNTSVDFTIAKADYNMRGAKWNYREPFMYDGKEHKVEVVGLPTGVTVESYENNTATAVGDYYAKANLAYDINNYNAPTVNVLGWTIYNDWTPTEYTVTAHNANGWLNSNFVITANDGHKVSLTNTADGDWKDALTYSGETADGSVTFYLKNETDGTISLAKTVTYKLDKTAPTGKVEFVNRNAWEEFVNTITFGLFFKDEVTVKATANDTLSGVDKIEYASADKTMTLDEVKAITDWTEYTDSFGVTLEDAKTFVYFVRITDKAGNVTYLSTDGAEYDTTAPVIDGVENGKTYYTTQKVTVTEKNVDTITLNGNPATENITLAGNKEATYTIVVTDKAGNTTTVTITMKPIKTLASATENLGNDNVTSDDAPALEELVETLDALLADEDVSDGERETLEQHKHIAESLIYTINDAADATDTENVGKVENVTPENVTPENKTDLENAKADLEKALEENSGNYTENEKKAIEDELGRIDDALEVIGNVEAVEELIDKLPDTIKKDDEAAIKAADDAYNSLSDYEKALVDEAAKKALTDAKAALAELNKTADTDSPQTGDNSNMFLWIALLFISGGAVITLTVVDRKRRMASNR